MTPKQREMRRNESAHILTSITRKAIRWNQYQSGEYVILLLSPSWRTHMYICEVVLPASSRAVLAVPLLAAPVCLTHAINAHGPSGPHKKRSMIQSNPYREEQQ